MHQEANTTKSVEQSENTTSGRSPWRYRCPNGHSSWKGLANSDEYRCKTCGVRFSKGKLRDLREESAES